MDLSLLGYGAAAALAFAIIVSDLFLNHFRNVLRVTMSTLFSSLFFERMGRFHFLVPCAVARTTILGRDFNPKY